MLLGWFSVLLAFLMMTKEVVAGESAPGKLVFLVSVLPALMCEISGARIYGPKYITKFLCLSMSPIKEESFKKCWIFSVFIYSMCISLNEKT